MNAYLLQTKSYIQMNYQLFFVKVFLKLAFLNSALTAIKKQDPTIWLLEMLQVLALMTGWAVNTFWCSKAIHYEIPEFQNWCILKK